MATGDNFKQHFTPKIQLVGSLLDESTEEYQQLRVNQFMSLLTHAHTNKWTKEEFMRVVGILGFQDLVERFRKKVA